MGITERTLRRLIRSVLIEHDMSLDTLVKAKVSGDDACPDCKGTGKYIPIFGPAEDCQLCHGTGGRSQPQPQPISPQPQQPKTKKKKKRRVADWAKELIEYSLRDNPDIWNKDFAKLDIEDYLDEVAYEIADSISDRYSPDYLHDRDVRKAILDQLEKPGFWK